MYCGFNEVNVRLDVWWHAIAFASQVIFAALRICVNAVLGPEERFRLVNSSIELDPILTL